MKNQKPGHTRRRVAMSAAAILASGVVLVGSALSASAYNPSGSVVTQLGNQPCLKGTGNCIIYPKSVQLPDGRLVMAFEKATVAPSGSADGETMPIWTSDDYGTSWTHLSDVPAPAYASADPQYAKYVSNWTNPNLYVLPEDLGALKAGTLLLASVVSGDDEYFKEQKAKDPNWVPTNDGDRSNIAIGLYASTDNGNSWEFINIIAEGGWQGGSAGNIGVFSAANVNKQVDPVWEPKMMMHNGALVTYYSDENDYLSYSSQTGIATLDPDNDTASDSRGQVLVHRTWDGSGKWSEPIIDAPGLTQDMGNGKTQIGAGRPGMTYMTPTTDGQWMMTFEWFGGGTMGRVKVGDDPLRFFDNAQPNGVGIDTLPVSPGSSVLNRGGSPVTVTLPGGRIAFNSDGSGDIWVNDSGRSDGTWTQYQSPLGSGYSRNLTYVEGTGRLNILQGVWGGSTAGSEIRSADVDLGDSDGTYYQFVNKKTGQVIGTGNNPTSASIGNGWRPDIKLEDAGSVDDKDTQYWHLITKSDGNLALLNKAGGREATPWGGGASDGQQLGQWVDEVDEGRWSVTRNTDGSVTLRSTANASLYLTGSTQNGPVTLGARSGDGSQDWTLVPLAPATSQLTSKTQSGTLAPSTAVAGSQVVLDAAVQTPAGAKDHANVTGQVFLYRDSQEPISLGSVAFDADQKGQLSLPANTANGNVRIGVTFDNTALVWTPVDIINTALRLESSASTRMIGSKAYITVTAVNNSTVPVTFEVATPYGKKTFKTVQPGKKVSVSINSTKTSIPAGKATVTATATIDGKKVTATSEASYNAQK